MIHMGQEPLKSLTLDRQLAHVHEDSGSQWIQSVIETILKTYGKKVMHLGEFGSDDVSRRLQWKKSCCNWTHWI